MRRVLHERGIRTELADAYRYAASVFSKVVSDGYLGMVKTVPQLYGLVYDRAERAPVAGGFRVWAAEFTARNLRVRIERTRPSVVVCTHAFPCNAMDAYKRLVDPTLPVMGIVTDLVVHPFWIYRTIDAYAVATAEMGRMLAARGVDPERIGVDGIPVDPRFGEPADPQRMRASLALPPDRPVVLVMGGGLGLGPVARAVRALAALDRPLTTVVLVGKNRALGRRIGEAAQRDGADVRVVGFVENVYDYMRAADVLVTKPGGLTTSEALASQTPMVLVRPLPGQEQRNARELVTRGAAVRADRSGDLARAVERLLDDAGARAALRRGVAGLRHPDAAVRIADRIATLYAASAARASATLENSSK